MKIRRLIVSIFFGLSFFASYSLFLSAVHANIIDATFGTGAGSFELGNFVDGGGSNVGGSNFMGMAQGDTTIVGWTVGGPGDGVDWLTEPGFNADVGVHSVDLQHLTNSSIFTIIPTNTGNVYQLTFRAAASTLPLATSAEGVVSAGSLINQPFVTVFSDNTSNQTFIPFSYLFTATGPSTTIEFIGTGSTGLGTNSYGPVIDSVAVSAIPIPATVFLFGSGLLFLLGLLKSRRNIS